MKKAVYIDKVTGKIKNASHVAFDEGMSDCNNSPPYVCFLKNALSKENQTAITLTNDHLKIDVSLSPFNHVVDVECLLDLSSNHPLGFQVE